VAHPHSIHEKHGRGGHHDHFHYSGWPPVGHDNVPPRQPALGELRAARAVLVYRQNLLGAAAHQASARAERLPAARAAGPGAAIRADGQPEQFPGRPLRATHYPTRYYAELLDEEGVSKLQTLVRLSQRMEALIDSLLQMSRIGRLDLEVQPTNMNQLVAEVLELLHPRLEQTHTTVEVRGPLPTVPADPTRLREVLNNLLSNALKYSDKTERYVVVGEATPGKAGIRGAANPDDYYVFYVQDNGIGIDPRHHDTIFRIFRRLHAQDKYGGGTGAGLAIAKKMIEKHGGELWVESVIGQGATFYFSILKII
nr:ethylene receptor 1 [Tanacetum cinerariifolium]